MIRYLLALAASAAAVAATAGPLWQNTTTGMSVDEVRRAQPAAIAVELKPPLPSPPYVKLALPHVQIAGGQFRVSFLFTGDRLEQVALLLEDPQFIENDLGIADGVITALRAKYGREISSAGSTSFGITSISKVWAQDATSVRLNFSSARTVRSLFSILYSDTVARDSGKL